MNMFMLRLAAAIRTLTEKRDDSRRWLKYFEARGLRTNIAIESRKLLDLEEGLENAMTLWMEHTAADAA